MEQATAWLEAFKSGALHPPRDVRNGTLWDEYWRNHIRVGQFEQGFNDMMASDPHLVAWLERRGVRTVLCTGNGLSTEALVLALHGFDVTALDIASVPATVQSLSLTDPRHPARTAVAITRVDATYFTFSSAAGSTAQFPMHRGQDQTQIGGGSLRLATGDLLDPTVCPGPYDAVIERRTLQLFPADLRAEGLSRVVARLSARATFVSHEHQGGWRPGGPRTHFADAWLRAAGFEQDDASPRVAKLIFSTG
jgi:hypothetical protein